MDFIRFAAISPWFHKRVVIARNMHNCYTDVSIHLNLYVLRRICDLIVIIRAVTIQTRALLVPAAVDRPCDPLLPAWHSPARPSHSRPMHGPPTVWACARRKQSSAYAPQLPTYVLACSLRTTHDTTHWNDFWSRPLCICAATGLSTALTMMDAMRLWRRDND